MDNSEKFRELASRKFSIYKWVKSYDDCVSFLMDEMYDSYRSADIPTIDIEDDMKEADEVYQALEKHIENCTPHQLSSWDVFYKSCFEDDTITNLFVTEDKGEEGIYYE